MIKKNNNNCFHFSCQIDFYAPSGKCVWDKNVLMTTIDQNSQLNEMVTLYINSMINVRLYHQSFDASINSQRIRFFYFFFLLSTQKRRRKIPLLFRNEIKCCTSKDHKIFPPDKMQYSTSLLWTTIQCHETPNEMNISIYNPHKFYLKI